MYAYIYKHTNIYIFVHRDFPCIKVCSAYSPIQENAWVLFFIAQDA